MPVEDVIEPPHDLHAPATPPIPVRRRAARRRRGPRDGCGSVLLSRSGRRTRQTPRHGAGSASGHLPSTIPSVQRSQQRHHRPVIHLLDLDRPPVERADPVLEELAHLRWPRVRAKTRRRNFRHRTRPVRAHDRVVVAAVGVREGAPCWLDGAQTRSVDLGHGARSIPRFASDRRAPTRRSVTSHVAIPRAVGVESLRDKPLGVRFEPCLR
jgi:hypothetical protein